MHLVLLPVLCNSTSYLVIALTLEKEMDALIH